MSTAFVFLVVAIGVATAGSAVLWFLSGRRRDQQPDYHEQLRAIAPSSSRDPIDEPSRIVPVPLEELGDEER